MLWEEKLYIWKSKEDEDIYLKQIKTENEYRSNISIEKWIYDILNQEWIKIGDFKLRKTINDSNENFFDMWFIELEKYWYAWKWIWKQIYISVNKILKERYNKELHSDRFSLSKQAFDLRKCLENKWIAEYLWLNMEVWTYFDNQELPTPMFKMK